VNVHRVFLQYYRWSLPNLISTSWTQKASGSEYAGLMDGRTDTYRVGAQRLWPWPRWRCSSAAARCARPAAAGSSASRRRTPRSRGTCACSQKHTTKGHFAHVLINSIQRLLLL